MPSNLNLEINNLSLTGANIPRSLHAALQASVEHELAHLLEQQGLPHQLRQNGEIRWLPVEITLEKTERLSDLGRMIAESIYSQLGEVSSR
jgi:hypothetical protein